MNISAKPLSLLTLGLSVAILTASAWSQPNMRSGAPRSGDARGGFPRGGPPPQERADRMVKRISNDLSLTASQQARMKTIITASIAQTRSINSNASLSLDQKQAQQAQIARAMRAKLDGVLTPAQKQKRIALQKQKDAQQGTRRMAALDRQAKQLNLTPQQTVRMKTVAMSAMKQHWAVRDSKTLQPEQKRAKNRQITQTMRTQMEALLTPAQRQKMQAMRQQGRGERGQGMRPMGAPR